MATRKGRLTTSLRSVASPRYLDTENLLDVSGVDATGNNSALGWVRYKDAAAARPVDGVGGSPTIVQPVTVTTVTPLSQGRSLLFQKNSGDAQGEGWSAQFKIDDVHLAKVLQIEFDYKVDSGTFVAGVTNDFTTAGDSDLIVYLFDVDNNVLIEPTTFRLYSNTTNIADRFIGNFQTSANGVNYRLILHVARNSTAAWTLKIDNISVKPAKYTYGTPITDWQQYTPTLINHTIGSGGVIYGRWRRVGNNAEIYVYVFRGTSGGSASGHFYVSLPPGLNVDASKFSVNSLSGVAYVFDNPINNYTGIVSVDIANHRMAIQLNQFANLVETNIPNTGWWTSAGINSYELLASVPIAGWSSSVKISEPMELRDVVVFAFRSGSFQSINNATPTKVLFNSKLIDTTNSFNESTSGPTASRFTAPISGFYVVSAELHYTPNSNGGRIARILKNGTVYSSQTFQGVAGGYGTGAVIKKLIYLNAGDYIEIETVQNSGSTLNLHFNDVTSGYLTYLSIYRLPSSQALAQSEQVMGYAYKTSTQSIPNNTPTVLSDFVKDQDTHNAMNQSTGVIVAPRAGYLTLSAGALFAASSSGDIREIQVAIGSTVVARSAVPRRSDNTAHATISVTGIRVNAGDQITVRVLQNSGASLNITGTTDRYNFVSWKIE